MRRSISVILLSIGCLPFSWHRAAHGQKYYARRTGPAGVDRVDYTIELAPLIDASEFNSPGHEPSIIQPADDQGAADDSGSIENGCSSAGDEAAEDSCSSESGCTSSDEPEPSCGVSDAASCTSSPSCAHQRCACRHCKHSGKGNLLCRELEDPISVWDQLLGDHESAWNLGGWLQAGYTNESDGLFNTLPDRFNTHQAWLYAEREPDTENKPVDWGFRVDVMYGVDADDTQAFGNNPGRYDFQNGWDRGAGYGWALPQLYGVVANEDVSVMVGHFFTLVGYEVVPATGNFFFTHAYTMYNSEPFTHTGAVATINMSEDVVLYSGWTLGWDTGFDQFSNGSSFLGGLGLTLSEDLSLTYITTFGDLGFRGDGYSHSIVLDATLNEKMNYVFQSDLVRADNVDPGKNDDVGVNQYLFYDLCDSLAVGTRVEWWKSDGTSFQEMTTGFNYRPHRELRDCAPKSATTGRRPPNLEPADSLASMSS